MNSEAMVEVDDLLCFDLYAASRALTALYRPLLADLGLTYPQYLVLVVLWREGPQSVGQLAEALCLDYGTLSPLLRRMAEHGLITRERSTADERSVTISPTSTALELQPRSAPIQAAIRRAVDLDDASIRDLQLRLRALTGTATAAHGHEGRES